MTNTRDYIVRATAANSQIRAFAIQSKNLVEKARQVHHTSPVATAALGRLLSGAAMMGSMMKGENDILTHQMTADSHANVKGYVGNPNVIIGPNYAGKLDVGAAIGYGTLSVSKDLGLKEPYNSQIPLTTSEVAEDLTYYFAKSEQVPSAVGLGVLMSKENTVEQAGGFIIQLMPFAEESVIDILEKKVEEITSVTTLLEEGYTPEMLLEKLLGDFGLEILDTLPSQFSCNCSKDKVLKALISIGKKELREMITEGKSIEVHCHFCNTNYEISVEEMKQLL